MANVIPSLEIKPEKVILLTTSEESNTARNIKKVLENNKVKTEIFPGFISPYKLDKIKKSVEKIISGKGSEYILNVTGGTKTMAITAFEVFKENNMDVVYYDPDHNEIISMHPEKNPFKVNLKISIKDYLQSYGYIIKEEMTASRRAESKINFFKSFGETRFSEFIHFIDYIKRNFSLSETKIYKKIFDFSFNKNFDEVIIKDFKSGEKVKYELKNFKFGDFLEDFVYLKLKEKDFDEIKYGVKLSNGKVKNEIDVIAVKDCRLYLYSCKSGKSDQYDIMQLDILRKLAGGIFGKAGFFASINANDSLKERAKALNVELIDEKSLFKI
jgi:hypothetical protein